MPRKLDLSPEQRKARERELKKKQNQRYKEKKQQEKQQKQAKALETLTESDPATTAAIVNQRYEYSKIIAYHKFKNKVTICEHMKLYEDSMPFRVKVTTYESFSSKADAIDWMKSHGCKKLDLF